MFEKYFIFFIYEYRIDVVFEIPRDKKARICLEFFQISEVSRNQVLLI